MTYISSFTGSEIDSLLQFTKDVRDTSGDVLMLRTFYVDAENGSDDNDGSMSSPFATIGKAIDSIPVGGSGNIILKSNIVVSDTERISLEDSGRLIQVYGYNTETPDHRRTMTFKIKPIGSYNSVCGFTGLGECAFGLHYINVVFVDEHDPELPFDTFAQAFTYDSMKGGNFHLYLRESKVTIPDISPVNLAHAKGAGIGTVVFNGYNSEIYTEGTNSYPFRITNSTFVYNVHSVTLSGSKTNHADLFVGIVRDVNGVPRNVVSNIVL